METIQRDAIANHGLFLLGGHDLEMLTIRSLLERYDIPYKDHCLTWHNARVSSYWNEIIQAAEENRIIWGIELQEDRMLPSCYRRIDHHSQWSDLPSALEQVAALLGVPMDRYMQLVAANDKAYIPGMTAMGATSEEITSIRRADRLAQGVTEEDERLAELAIAEHSRKVRDLWIVGALSNCFSPICDRLYPYHRLLVYTEREWVYYGQSAHRVAELFSREIMEKKIYTGGGPDGYVGAVRDQFLPSELKIMISQIIEL